MQNVIEHIEGLFILSHLKEQICPSNLRNVRSIRTITTLLILLIYYYYEHGIYSNCAPKSE